MGLPATDIPPGTFLPLWLSLGKTVLSLPAWKQPRARASNSIWWVELKGEKRQGLWATVAIKRSVLRHCISLKPTDRCGLECLPDGTSWDSLGITHSTTLSFVSLFPPHSWLYRIPPFSLSQAFWIHWPRPHHSQLGQRVNPDPNQVTWSYELESKALNINI